MSCIIATNHASRDLTNRWYVHLAHNLAVGAALCRAFRLGGKYADDLWDVDAHTSMWRPGCGRRAP